MPQTKRCRAGHDRCPSPCRWTPQPTVSASRRQDPDRQNSGSDQAFVERAHDRIVGAELDEIGADDGGDDAGARRSPADRAWPASSSGSPAKKIAAEHHGGDDRHRIGFEKIGRHAGAIADIVADVIGDGRGIARIVFGNAGLDLADEIGADVGALGEDAAAEAGEDRNQRGAEAQRDQRVDDDAVDGARPRPTVR